MPEAEARPRGQPHLTAPAAVPLVDARQVTRAFQVAGQTVTALQGATLQICPGDRVALLGASGSGKSTLLHLLGGLDTPTSGTVTWPALGNGQDLRPGKVAFVFQAQSLMPPLTALENVALPLLLNGKPPNEAQEEAAFWLERLELLPLADHLPEELSGGQAQRVAVARALVTHPRLILADEPTGQLDSATAQHLLDVLLAALDPGAALVMATHDPDVARRLDTIWRMQDGQLVSVTRRQEETS
ncbi:ABC transporter ATP-binding protein [Deinococcus metallilatus]|uniref:ABC transport system ATP-binding protein/lipoprotein-releasing system ATP-binding protein n=1 Tax=Deinococcus metallilatus TaxID=1211322 RepID=A0AAJ5K0D0_9DEIO|nr:ABC transporter ATP-binding protein [Deinococcus metallilatus]MBB5294984.1 putative ABC transport system ATP-binding protein/lipoprotein-releasing system ATP-binding protein [Deinococcus metallilatus]QBY09323.1 ABC transporter ATP-binding protein [Deinococcus metallilatus]RXJ09328.1 ABC transporter ATP-binding protein [Deinococcus metallilatus]TLK28850.1 ABC transporter ATP-binding protein [Deinococcus metallilatus]GMA16916.1 ABC transporter ATP-binding protein [Deinococcus metallilatus]